MKFAKVELPVGEVVHVVPVGEDVCPSKWWPALLLRVDSARPEQPFLVQSQQSFGAHQQWVSTIMKMEA
jgi:hypothetical protein